MQCINVVLNALKGFICTGAIFTNRYKMHPSNYNSRSKQVWATSWLELAHLALRVRPEVLLLQQAQLQARARARA